MLFSEVLVVSCYMCKICRLDCLPSHRFRPLSLLPTRLFPNHLFLNKRLETTDDNLVPCVKYTPKKTRGPAVDEDGPEANLQHPVGFGAASSARRADMEKAGLEWRVAPASKDQKKAEQARRRLLAGAKHLLK